METEYGSAPVADNYCQADDFARAIDVKTINFDCVIGHRSITIQLPPSSPAVSGTKLIVLKPIIASTSRTLPTLDNPNGYFYLSNRKFQHAPIGQVCMQFERLLPSISFIYLITKALR
jgi:hypothetical protein